MDMHQIDLVKIGLRTKRPEKSGIGDAGNFWTSELTFLFFHSVEAFLFILLPLITLCLNVRANSLNP